MSNTPPTPETIKEEKKQALDFVNQILCSDRRKYDITIKTICPGTESWKGDLSIIITRTLR